MNAASLSDWKPIPGQPKYLVHADGLVWSVRAGRTIIGTSASGMRYRAIQFPDGKREYIHRLICAAFHGPQPSQDHEVRHLNGDHLDNRAANLAWGTKHENEADRKRHGTTAVGERNPQAKLTLRAVEEMRACREGEAISYAKIAERFGVSTMTAYRAITGESWNASSTNI